MKNKLILLCFVGVLTACGKSKKSDPLPEDTIELPGIWGSWTWVKSTGSPNLEDEFPNDTLQRQAVFNAENQLFYFQNSNVTNRYRYYVTRDGSTNLLHVFDNGLFLYKMRASFPHQDTLNLFELIETRNNDHTYVRF